MNVALSKLILIFSFVSKSTLAAGSNYKLADLPDFHRDDGYGDMLQSEYVTSTPINRPHDELLALGTSDRIYSQLHEIRVLPEQTVNSGSWIFLNASQSVVQVSGFCIDGDKRLEKKYLLIALTI